MNPSELLTKFLSAKSALEKGRIQKVLGRELVYDGQVMTRQEFVEKAAEKGLVGEQQVIQGKGGGTYWFIGDFEATKMEVDYLNHLKESKKILPVGAVALGIADHKEEAIWNDDKEKRFRAWYGELAAARKLNPDPDDPSVHQEYRVEWAVSGEPSAYRPGGPAELPRAYGRSEQRKLGTEILKGAYKAGPAAVRGIQDAILGHWLGNVQRLEAAGQEEKTLIGRAARELTKFGVGELPKAGIAGGLAAVEETISTAHDLAEWLGDVTHINQLADWLDQLSKGEPPPVGEPGILPMEGAEALVQYEKGKIPKPQVSTMAGGLAQGIAQFMTGFLIGSKVMKAAKVGIRLAESAPRLAQFIRSAGAGGIADLLVWDPEDPRLSNLLEEYLPSLKNPITDYLKAQPGDTRALGRMKQAIEGQMAGGLSEALVLLLRGAKAAGMAIKGNTAARKARSLERAGIKPPAGPPRIPIGSIEDFPADASRNLMQYLSLDCAFSKPKELKNGFTQVRLLKGGEEIGTLNFRFDPDNTLHIRRAAAGQTIPNDVMRTISGFADANQSKIISNLTGFDREWQKQGFKRSGDSLIYEAAEPSSETLTRAAASLDQNRGLWTDTDRKLYADLATLSNRSWTSPHPLPLTSEIQALAYYNEGLGIDPQTIREWMMEIRHHFGQGNKAKTVLRNRLRDNLFGGNYDPVAHEKQLATMLQDWEGGKRKEVLGFKVFPEEGVVTAHQTSPEAAESIRAGGFRVPSGAEWDDKRIMRHLDDAVPEGVFAKASSITIPRGLATGTDVQLRVLRDRGLKVLNIGNKIQWLDGSYHLPEDLSDWELMEPTLIHYLTEAGQQEAKKIRSQMLHEVNEIYRRNGNYPPLAHPEYQPVANLTAKMQKLFTEDLRKQGYDAVYMLDDIPGTGFEPGRPEQIATICFLKPEQARALGVHVPYQRITDLAKEAEELAKNWDEIVEEQRRGKIPMAVDFEEGRKSGLTGEDLQKVKPGTIFISSRMARAMELFNEAGQNVRTLAEKALHTRDEADYAEAMQAFMLNAGLYKVRKGLSAEAGRLLHILTDPVSQWSAFLDQFGPIYRSGEKDPWKMMQMIASVQTPEELQAFAAQATKATTWDMVYEGWINSLLSGPRTHSANFFSNMLAAMAAIPERELAAMFPGDIQHGEGIAMFLAGLSGFADGMRLAAKTMRTGQSAFGQQATKLEYLQGGRKAAITAENAGLDPNTFGGQMMNGLGYAFRTFGNALMASDDLWKMTNYRAEIAAQSWRKAVKERGGKTFQELFQAVDAELADPSEEVRQAASQWAERQTFTKAVGNIGEVLMTARRTIPGFRILAPFIRTPTNIFKYSMEYTPGLNMLLGEYRRAISGEMGSAAKQLAEARMSMGVMAWTMVALGVEAGSITGEGPKDALTREEMMKQGWRPYSIRVGKRWVPYGRLDPWGMTVGAMANIMEIADQDRQFDFGQVVSAVLLSTSNAMLSKSYVTSLANFAEIFSGDLYQASRFTQGLATTVIPFGALAGQTAKAIDPVWHEVNGTVDALRSRVPWVSKGIPRRRDFYAAPIWNDSPWSDLIFETHKVEEDPVRTELLNRKFFNQLNKPPRTIGGYAPPKDPRSPEMPGVGVELNDEQYDLFQRLRANYQGELGKRNPAYKNLPTLYDQHRKIIESPLWKDETVTDTARMAMLREPVGLYREAALEELLKAYPDLAHKYWPTVAGRQQFRVGPTTVEERLQPVLQNRYPRGGEMP